MKLRMLMLDMARGGNRSDNSCTSSNDCNSLHDDKFFFFSTRYYGLLRNFPARYIPDFVDMLCLSKTNAREKSGAVVGEWKARVGKAKLSKSRIHDASSLAEDEEEVQTTCKVHIT